MMLIRLLYRLALQRLDERRALRASPAVHGAGVGLPVPPAAPRRLGLAFALSLAAAIAAAIAAGLALLEFEQPGVVDGAALAELRLEIATVAPAPLVVYLTGADLERPAPAPAPAEVPRITSVDAAFAPHFQVLAADSTVEMFNADAIAHNTHVFNRGETVFNVGLPYQGVAVRKTLTGSEIFSVRCDIHPWMQGWLFVPPTRHYAVLDRSGSVTFTGVPPGEHVLHLWQPDRVETLHVVALAPGETRSLRLP